MATPRLSTKREARLELLIKQFAVLIGHEDGERIECVAACLLQ